MHSRITVTDFVSSTGSTKLLSAVALNASAETRTITLQLNRAWRRIRVLVDFTRSAASTVTCAMTELDETSAEYTPQVLDLNVSPAALTDMTFTKTTSATGKFSFTIDVEGLHGMKLLFGGASAGGSDLVTVRIQGIKGA